MYKNENNQKDDIVQIDHFKSRTTSINSIVSSQKKDEPIEYRKNTMVMFTIITGQILALLGTGNGMLSTVLEKKFKIVTPFLLTSSYYLLLAIIWIIIKRKIKKPKMSYILITLFDSQANFLNIYAFSVVHFNYPFIINVSSVFWTCLLTWIFIRKYKYKKFHIIGVGISILGVAITLYGSLSMIDNTDKIFENMVGLSYCLGASILYSISGILQEIYFKSGKDIYEFFPWQGIIGCLLTVGESFILREFEKIIYEYNFDVEVGLLWFGSSIILVIFTSIAPFFIKRYSASMFNISLVSQIFWSYLVDVIFFGGSVPKGVQYYLGFVIIILGIFIFNKYPVTTLVETRESNKYLTQNLIDEKDKKNSFHINNDNISENSSTSGFNAEKKYNYYKNTSLYTKAHKILNLNEKQ